MFWRQIPRATDVLARLDPEPQTPTQKQHSVAKAPSPTRPFPPYAPPPDASPPYHPPLAHKRSSSRFSFRGNNSMKKAVEAVMADEPQKRDREGPTTLREVVGIVLAEETGKKRSVVKLVGLLRRRKSAVNWTTGVCRTRRSCRLTGRRSRRTRRVERRTSGLLFTVLLQREARHWCNCRRPLRQPSPQPSPSDDLRNAHPPSPYSPEPNRATSIFRHTRGPQPLSHLDLPHAPSPLEQRPPSSKPLIFRLPEPRQHHPVVELLSRTLRYRHFLLKRSVDAKPHCEHHPSPPPERPSSSRGIRRRIAVRAPLAELAHIQAMATIAHRRQLLRLAQGEAEAATIYRLLRPRTLLPAWPVDERRLQTRLSLILHRGFALPRNFSAMPSALVCRISRRRRGFPILSPRQRHHRPPLDLPDTSALYLA